MDLKTKLLKQQYSPKQSTDSIQSYQNPNGLVFIFWRNGKVDPKIDMKLQGTSNSQKNPEESHFLISKLTTNLQ